MKKTKRISFYVTESEYEKLEISANKFGIGVNALAKQKTLNPTKTGCEQRLASLMAEMYYWADQTQDMTAKKHFITGGDTLCHILK